MTDICSAPPDAGAGFIGSTTAFLDCQAQNLGSGAWAALAVPGSTLSIVLAGLLTIFIALVGYNLLLGSAMTVRGATIAFVKIGAVFALATSWPAYRSVVYGLVTDGPGQLVGEIGPRAGVVGSDGTLVERLDLADRGLVQLSILGAGSVPPNERVDVPPPPFGGFEAFALGGSRILFLLAAIAGLSAVRLVAGLMLALGPFFVAFLLFDGTRGLFEGWVRVLAGAAIASVSASIVLGLELAFVEPWLAAVLARRMSGEPLPNVPTELFVILCLFAVALVASLYASYRVARGFRLPPAAQLAFAGARETATASATLTRHSSETRSGSADVERSRAAAVADIFASATRRSGYGHRLTQVEARQERAPQGRGSNEGRQALPLGRTFSRRPGARVSALAAKRDMGA